MEKLQQQANQCTACDLHKSRHMVVFGQIIKDSPVLIVGEAPGHMEDVAGEPFVGRCGSVLRKRLGMVGINPDECSIVNTVQCRPPDNRKPTETELFFCKDYLDKKIDYISPKVIMVCGATAIWRLLVKKNLDYNKPLMAKMGQISPFLENLDAVKVLDKMYPCLANYHPSYWMRLSKSNPHNELVWRQLAWLKECSLGNFKQPTPDLYQQFLGK